MNMNMSTNFEQRFQSLELSFNSNCQQIFQQLQGIGDSTKRNAEQLAKMKLKQDDLTTRLGELEWKMEQREQQDRRTNLLFHGLKEDEGEACPLNDIVLQLLKEYIQASPGKTQPL